MKNITLTFLFLVFATCVAFAQDTIRAAFEVAPECFGAETQFINKTYVPSTLGSVDYLWKFGDGKTSTSQFGKHTYKLTDSSTNQVFKATLVVTSKTNPPDIDSVSQNVTVYGLPKVNFTWKVMNDGVNQQVVIETVAVDNALYFYQWTLGGVLKSNDRKPTFSGAELKPFLDGQNHSFSLFMRSPEGCENQEIKLFNYNPASINDVEFSVKLFAPNPAKSSIQILMSVDKLQIVDLNGRIVKSIENATIVSLEDLTSGLYFVKASTGVNTVMQRLWIQ